MLEYLFPGSKDHARLQLKLAALATVATAAFAAFALWLGASFVGMVGGNTGATVQLVSAGDSLGVNSGVKFRGLRVGRVIDVSGGRDDSGFYTARIVIDDEFTERVPAALQARVLPGTVFGAEYVDLVQTGPSATKLADGAVIPPDQSEATVRLMDTFSAVSRVLTEIDIETIDLATSQFARALDGRGDDLRRFIGKLDRLTAAVEKAQPQLFEDLDLLAEVLPTLADVEPGLAEMIKDSLPVARTVAAKARQIEQVTAATDRISAQISNFLERHGGQFTRFVKEVRPTYRAFVGGIKPFSQMLDTAVAVLANGAGSISDGAIQMAAIFSAGSAHAYTSADCPRYEHLKGANCQ